jgi:hypothetical protein
MLEGGPHAAAAPTTAPAGGHRPRVRPRHRRLWRRRGVYRLHPDYSVQLNKDLMDSATQTSEDPQTIVYKIKQNAAWSDGTPVSADDLEYLWRNLNGSVKGNDVASTTGYDQIESVEGSDNGKTVTVVFKEPFTDWKSLFYGLLPARYMAEVPGGWNTGLDKNPERIPRQRPLPHRAVVRASRLQLQERAPGRPGGPQGHRHRPQHPRDREPDRQAVHRQGPAAWATASGSPASGTTRTTSASTARATPRGRRRCWRRPATPRAPTASTPRTAGR